MAISPEPLIVGRQNWCQNARKNRFPIRDVEQPILYQFQKKSYFKKKNSTPIFEAMSHSVENIFCFFPLLSLLLHNKSDYVH